MDSNQFVDIKACEVFESNPFINNNHLKYIEPYSQLYERDKSKDKKRASNEFYAIWVLNSPDEQENKYLRLSKDKIKKLVEERFKIDWEDKLFKQCLEDYPSKIMTIPERALSAIQQKVLEREHILRTEKYPDDIYKKDEQGKYIKAGNTFMKVTYTHDVLDGMLKTSSLIMKDYKECAKMFAIEKDNISIRGQRRATDFEDGSLFSDYDF